MKCWGSNYSGEAGDGKGGELGAVLTPVSPIGLPPVKQVAAGWYHTCAVLLAGGHVECWGKDESGELGDGKTEIAVPMPVEVKGLAGVTQVSGASWSSCAVSAGQISCWGDGGDGQLGNGSKPAAQNTPTAVVGISTGQQVAEGEFQACATLANESTECWGSNSSGDLGNGEVGGDFTEPAPVKGLP